MGHRRGVAGQRFGAAEADRQLEDLQGVEEGERLLLAALDVEREGRAGAGALPGVGRRAPSSRARGTRDSGPLPTLGWSRRYSATSRAFELARSIRIASVSSERPSIQQECGSSWVPTLPRSALIGRMIALAPERGAGDQVGVAADILGERIERDIGAVRQRMLEHRARAGCCRRPGSAGSPGPRRSRRRSAAAARCRPACWSGWRASRSGSSRPGPWRAPPAAASRMAVSSTPSTKPDRADAEVRHGVGEQRLGPAVERLGMQDDVAGPGEGEDRRGDRRHAGGEHAAGLPRLRRPRAGPRRSRCWDG